MPRITKPTNDTVLRNAKSKEKDYKISDGQGLYLVVKRNGSKTWRFDFTYGKKRQSMSFGKYPIITLKEAREKREKAKELLTQNINPISKKKIEKASESLTLQNVVDEWIILRKKSVSEATVTANKRILKNVTEWLGNIAIKDISRIDIVNRLQKIQTEKGVVETAHRLLSLLNKIYMFALTKEYVGHNIIADIDKKFVLIPNDKDKHLPAITEPKEIKQLLLDINSIGEKFRCDICTIYIFKLIPYIFVRSENIRLMKWDEINFEEGLWEIPKQKMKMKIDFVFPLPIQAIKILKEIEPYSRHRSEFIFPSNQKNDRGVAGATLSYNLNKLGYQDRHTFHGFRSMFSTTAHEYYRKHGFSSDIIESCLAHKERNKVKAAYNRVSKYKYIEEKRELIQWYANWLDEVVKKES